MNPWLCRATVTAGFGLGVWLLTAAPAHADTSDTIVAQATLTLRLDITGTAAAPNTTAERPSGLVLRGALRVRSEGAGAARRHLRAAGAVVAATGTSPRTTTRRSPAAVAAVRVRAWVPVSSAPLTAARRPVTDPAVTPGPIGGRVCVVVGSTDCAGANGSSATPSLAAAADFAVSALPLVVVRRPLTDPAVTPGSIGGRVCVVVGGAGCGGATGSSGGPAAPLLPAAADLAVSAIAPAGGTGGTRGGAGAGQPVVLPEDVGSGVNPVGTGVLLGLRGGTGVTPTLVGAGWPSLPRTGVTVLSVMAVGLAVLGLGVLLLVAGRRRRT